MLLCWNAEGHQVYILDINDYSFHRLSSDFKGTALEGDGTSDETLRKAGIEGVDAFIALTSGRIIRNKLSTQLPSIFSSPQSAAANLRSVKDASFTIP